MSAFNTVETLTVCPVCAAEGRFEVQFKYGDTWQHHYQVGEPLRWGGNDVGVRGAALVVVDGIGGPCLNCGADFIESDVVIVDNIIESVALLAGARKVESELNYTVR